MHVILETPMFYRGGARLTLWECDFSFGTYKIATDRYKGVEEDIAIAFKRAAKRLGSDATFSFPQVT
jgi:hypothetical protein